MTRKNVNANGEEIEIRSTQDHSPEGGPIHADRPAVMEACIDLAEEFQRRLSASEYEADSYLQSLDERITDTKRWYQEEFDGE